MAADDSAEGLRRVAEQARELAGGDARGRGQALDRQLLGQVVEREGERGPDAECISRTAENGDVRFR